MQNPCTPPYSRVLPIFGRFSGVENPIAMAGFRGGDWRFSENGSGHREEGRVLLSEYLLSFRDFGQYLKFLD